jgi:hypothetical protein
MTSPQYDPSQQYTQADPMAGGQYGTPNPYAPQQQPYPQSPYPQSPYPQSAYPAAGYPAPAPAPVYAYPAVGPSGQTNTMAILSLVFAFVFCPLGIVFGHMAKKQIRERGEQGEGLATAGMILGYVFTGLLVVACVLDLVVFGAIATSAGVNN